MGFRYHFLLNLFLVLFVVVVAKADLFDANINVIKGLFGSQECNLFSGEWAFDSSLNPFYDSSTCPFIDTFDCHKFGRPDKQYLNYSWKPTKCSLPRFDGGKLLRKWKGKKIMFVGDSMCLNQWTSLACMIYASVPKTNTTFIRQEPHSSIRFEDYDVTMFLHRSRYLVDIITEAQGRILKLDAIEQGNATWKGMDVLIFGTYHWWTFTGNGLEWDLVQDGSTIAKDMDRMEAFTKGLTTWARWVDQNVDPSKTKVFFQGVTPDHYLGQEWGSNSNCTGEQLPTNGTTYPAGKPEAANIVDSVLSTIKKPVYLLNITTLSQLRKDAHPSIYNIANTTDCTHWCLPGLPDTWNQLLYAALVASSI